MDEQPFSTAYGRKVKVALAKKVKAALPEGSTVIAGFGQTPNLFFFKDHVGRRWVARKTKQGDWVACRNTTFGPLMPHIASAGTKTDTVAALYADFAKREW
jgi:hypothetical protein